MPRRPFAGLALSLLPLAVFAAKAPPPSSYGPGQLPAAGSASEANPKAAKPAPGPKAPAAAAPAKPSGPPKIEFVDPASPMVSALKRHGETAAGVVSKRLLDALNAALASGGPVAAVEVCQTKAPALTAEKLPNRSPVTAVKRTSLRLRNPANAPDDAERAALDRVAAAVAKGEPPPAVLVQRIQTSDTAKPEWRVYKPIVAQPACLVCHGDPAAQPPGLRAALQQRYPADAATGYAAGEWRGLLRLTVTP